MTRPGARSFADPSGDRSLSHDRHGVDIAAVEAAAVAVLEMVPESRWDGRPPVPVDWIAEELFGYRIVTHRGVAGVAGVEMPEGETMAGLLLPDRGLILVEEEEIAKWPNRRRFTVAHEIGHHVLHRSDPLWLEQRNAAGSRGTGLPLSEAEAHAFAAALLMPAAIFRPAAEACAGDWRGLPDLFLTTRGAVERRLRTLGFEDQLSEPRRSQQ